MDLERANSFGDFQTTHYEEFQDEDEGIMDEERVNWPILCARIFSFFLLFCIFVFVALGGLDLLFLIIAAIISGFLIFVVIATYRDPRLWCQKPPKKDRRVRATIVRPPSVIVRTPPNQAILSTTANPMFVQAQDTHK